MPVQRICSTARGTGSGRSTTGSSEAAAFMFELASLREVLADITDRLHQVEVQADERTRTTVRVLEPLSPPAVGRDTDPTPGQPERPNVINLPTRRTAGGQAIDLCALTALELQVIFYAAGARWIVAPDGQSLDRLTPIVVDTINRLGLDLVRDIARQADAAAKQSNWAAWDHIWSSMDRYADAHALAHLYRRRIRRASGQMSPLTAFHTAVAA